MRFREHGHVKRAEMQLAPMIDVVFILLIFFIVTWNFARFEADVDIEVPNAETAEDSPPTPGEIVVNVNRDGEVKVNQAVLEKEQLLEKLTRVAEDFPNQPIILRGDKDTKFTHLMTVLETCQEAGIWNVAFAAEKPRNETVAP